MYKTELVWVFGAKKQYDFNLALDFTLKGFNKMGFNYDYEYPLAFHSCMLLRFKLLMLPV